MEFAIRLPSSNRIADVESIVSVARAAEDAGFYAVSVHDHLVYNGWWVACGARDTPVQGDDRDIFEALMTLSFVSAHTERVKLMTGILLLPVRDVVLAAKQVATLDVLSKGRVLLGVGVGGGSRGGQVHGGMDFGAHADNAQKEFETFAVPKRRGALVDEAIDAMRAIWTEESASFEGEFIRFAAIDVFPKPVQAGGPPILIGGNSAAARQRVAVRGDGWLPSSVTAEDIANGTEDIKRRCSETGRPAPAGCALNIFCSIAKSDADAMEKFQPTLGGVFGSDLLTRNLVGSPHTVVEGLQKYAAAGVELVELKPIYRTVPELIEMIGLCSKEVMPTFK